MVVSLSCDLWMELPTRMQLLVMLQFEKQIQIFFYQDGPRDRTSTSASALWEAHAYKSPYENSHYTRTTSV